MNTAKWKKEIWKGYILYDSNHILEKAQLQAQ